jgi:hypothetical protein
MWRAENWDFARGNTFDPSCAGLSGLSRASRSVSIVIPGRASSREPGIQAAAQVGEAVWIPGSPLRAAPE